MNTGKEMNGDEENTNEEQEALITEEDKIGDIAGMKRETNGLIMIAEATEKTAEVRAENTASLVEKEK